MASVLASSFSMTVTSSNNTGRPVPTGCGEIMTFSAGTCAVITGTCGILAGTVCINCTGRTYEFTGSSTNARAMDIGTVTETVPGIGKQSIGAIAKQLHTKA